MHLFRINIYMWEIRNLSLQGFHWCLQRYEGFQKGEKMSLLNKGLDPFLVFCIKVMVELWQTNETVKPGDKLLSVSHVLACTLTQCFSTLKGF